MFPRFRTSLPTIVSVALFLAVTSSPFSRSGVAHAQELNFLNRNLQKCAGKDDRAQECGGGGSQPKKCCDGLECDRDGQGLKRCVKAKKEPAPLTLTLAPKPTNKPTKPTTNAVNESPFENAGAPFPNQKDQKIPSQIDLDNCAVEGFRAHDCGAGGSRQAKNCCPGFVCSDKNSQCVKDPKQPTIASTPRLTVAPTAPQTGAPTRSPTQKVVVIAPDDRPIGDEEGEPAKLPNNSEVVESTDDIEEQSEIEQPTKVQEEPTDGRDKIEQQQKQQPDDDSNTESETKVPDGVDERPDDSIVVDDIGIQVPPFVVSISFLTSARYLKFSTNNRALVSLAKYIEKDNELEVAVEDLIDQKLLDMYPETYQSLDLTATLLGEMTDAGVTTFDYKFTGQAIFLDNKSGNLPHSKTIKEATTEALEGAELSERLRWSGDPILEAVEKTAITHSDPSYGWKGDDSAPVIDASNGEKGDRGEIVAIVLVSIVGVGVVIAGAGLIYMRRKSKAAGKLVSQRPGLNGGEATLDTRSKESFGAPPSPSKTAATVLNDTYDTYDLQERESELGDCALDLALSDVDSSSNFGDSVVDNDCNSVAGRSDWSITEGNSGGYSTAGDSSFRGGGGYKSLFSRHDIDLTSTLRSMEDIASIETGASNPNEIDIKQLYGS